MLKPRRQARLLIAIFVTTAFVALAGMTEEPLANAIPAQSTHVVQRVQATEHESTLVVFSAAMNRQIPLTVLHPANTSTAPTLYLLNGAGGGEDSASWASRTDYREFFSNKQINVVTPLMGAFSYYTDWVRDDPELGRQKWQTFLTEELPPVIDREFNTTGANAIAGISMSGTSVLNLAEQTPGLYRAVASYSGCARTSDPVGQAYLSAVIEHRGGARMSNMWGPLNGSGWVANDPYLNAAKLRGMTVYLSSNSGLPGEDEVPRPGETPGDTLSRADQVLLGGGIEAAMNLCTQQLAQRLSELRIPATVRLRNTGTHSWGYWERELKASWPTLQAALDR